MLSESLRLRPVATSLRDVCGCHLLQQFSAKRSLKPLAAARCDESLQKRIRQRERLQGETLPSVAAGCAVVGVFNCWAACAKRNQIGVLKIPRPSSIGTTVREKLLGGFGSQRGQTVADEQAVRIVRCFDE